MIDLDRIGPGPGQGGRVIVSFLLEAPSRQARLGQHRIG